MEPFFIGLLVFVTVFVGGLALLMRAPEREAVGARLDEIGQRSPRAMMLSLPFHRRTIFPLVRGVVDAVTRLIPPRSLAIVQSNLAMAGRHRDNPVVWVTLKWLSAAALAGIVYAVGEMLRWRPLVQAPLVLAVAGLGYLWPEFNLRRAMSRRQAVIIKELPETLDLLTISVEAGLGLDQALETVATRRPGPLAEEIRLYLDEIRLGRERHEALKAVGSRTGVEELISFTATLVQAIEFGVSIAAVLRIQADEVRTRRRQRIEERAMKAPVKLLFPLIFLILPALFVVVAGPGLIRVYTEFLRPTGPSQFAPPATLGR